MVRSSSEPGLSQQTSHTIWPSLNLSESRFNIGTSGQQIHVTCGPTDPKHSRHPCFKLPSRQDLEEIKRSIYEHHVRGGPAAPMAADKPGELNSGESASGYHKGHSINPEANG